MLAPGGSLLFVIPIGQPVLRFNGHRIYSHEQVRRHFGELILNEFTLIPELGASGGPIYNARPELADEERYGCGCFWFVKKT